MDGYMVFESFRCKKLAKLNYRPKDRQLINLWLKQTPTTREGLVSLFNGISTFVGYLMPKLSI